MICPGFLKQNTQSVPILVYHHVYPDESFELKQANSGDGAGIIGKQIFLRQLHFILDAGWNVVSTSQIVRWLMKKEVLPKKSMALHFDNGWIDTVTVALPILNHLGLTATCYPITEGIDAASEGKSKPIRTLTEGVIKRPFMNWDQVKLLLDSGWEIGAHTATHCKVVEQFNIGGSEAIISEIQESHDSFNSGLGFVPEHFAYPSGSQNIATDQLLAPYYKSLRYWDFQWPIQWKYTNLGSSPFGLECQNIDMRVPFKDFERIFRHLS